MIAKATAKLKKKQISIGIRLNPNTDAKTLNQISTGKKENKFGVNKKTLYEIVNYCKYSKNNHLKCLSVHIGSQILNHKPFEKMLNVVKNILDKIDHKFEFIDLGGGMGIEWGVRPPRTGDSTPALGRARSGWRPPVFQASFPGRGGGTPPTSPVPKPTGVLASLKEKGFREDDAHLTDDFSYSPPLR